MSELRWRVGIVDSGLDAQRSIPVIAQRRFTDDGTNVVDSEPVVDSLDHGTRVAYVIHSAARPCELLMAQALDASGASTPAAIAAAIRWLLSQEVQLLHLSLGLRQDRAPLAQAIQAAVEAGVLVVASSPARGEKTYPAAYAGVIAATGDARCAVEDISDLGAANADFGGCVQSQIDARSEKRGASIGAAHVSRFIVSHLPLGLKVPDARSQLAARAAYRGRERR